MNGRIRPRAYRAASVSRTKSGGGAEEVHESPNLVETWPGYSQGEAEGVPGCSWVPWPCLSSASSGFFLVFTWPPRSTSAPAPDIEAEPSSAFCTSILGVSGLLLIINPFPHVIHSFHSSLVNPQLTHPWSYLNVSRWQQYLRFYLPKE